MDVRQVAAAARRAQDEYKRLHPETRDSDMKVDLPAAPPKPAGCGHPHHHHHHHHHQHHANAHVPVALPPMAALELPYMALPPVPRGFGIAGPIPPPAALGYIPAVADVLRRGAVAVFAPPPPPPPLRRAHARVNHPLPPPPPLPPVQRRAHLVRADHLPPRPPAHAERVRQELEARQAAVEEYRQHRRQAQGRPARAVRLRNP